MRAATAACSAAKPVAHANPHAYAHVAASHALAEADTDDPNAHPHQDHLDAGDVQPVPDAR